jgi:S1-C subfamily serine protease
LVPHGRSAVRKIRAEGPRVQLSQPESLGLEAIIRLEGRPALLIQGGRFQEPPQDWRALEAVRTKIQAVFPSVGRIEVPGHPEVEWLGTGFLVADDVVMTNRHVAVEFCRQKGAHWVFEPPIKPRIDYSEELGTTAPAEFNLTEVIGVHETYDFALMRVSRKGTVGVRPPSALSLASKPTLAAKRQIFIVGYPASDSRRNDPVVMRRIFANIYDVKRLQPGEIMAVTLARKVMSHDCSTLGGNSGSCVVDLDTQRVVGLHFRGKYLESNDAIMLSRLAADPLIKRAKLNFV